MKPLRSNLSSDPKDTCTPTSARCIIWQGPDIPCINLCNGDNIEDVVFKLATQLCELTDGIIDISGLDFSCLLEVGQEDPAGLIELLQKMITKICLLEACCDEETPAAEIIVALPGCLQYDDPDPVVELPIDEYALLLATKICEILDDIEAFQVQLAAFDVRLTTVEDDLAGLPEIPTLPTITVQCASGPTPDEVLPIAEAFANLETTVCELKSTLGSNGELQASVAMQCVGLGAEDSLSVEGDLMSDLPGWIATPDTTADTINNIWVTICDMRDFLENISDVGVLCIPVAPDSVTVGTLEVTHAPISWVAPTLVGTEPVAAYRVEIWEYNESILGAKVFDTTYGANITSINVGNSIFTSNYTYQIRVYAIYVTCGESSPAMIDEVLKTDMEAICAEITFTDLPDDEITCLAAPYTNEMKRVTITLKSTLTGDPVINNTGVTMSMDVRFAYTDCALAPQEVDYTVDIIDGASSGYYDYISLDNVDCSGVCVEREYTYVCTPGPLPVGVSFCNAPDECAP